MPKVEIFEFREDASVKDIKEELNKFIPYHKILQVNTVYFKNKIVIFIYYED
ncbi:MAG: hypothetical protein NZ903_01645 [Candidatus Micrarchaeota archaeon]|nr:hypothetical protein [Candidatus Micrarchaeota archaeon]